MQMKASCLLLTGALVLLTALPSAYAAAPPVPAPDNSQTITIEPTPSPEPTVTLPDTPSTYPVDTGETVTFEGHIAPQIVSAIVPCSISFHMDPNEETTLDTENGDKISLNEVMNADTSVVKNNSIWPFRVSVTAVGADAPQGATPVTPVSSLDPGEGQVLLVLGEKDVASATKSGGAQHTFQSKAHFLGQALLVDQATKPPLPILDVGAHETKTLWVYGKAAKEEQAYRFTVTVTMRIDWIRNAGP